MYEALFTSNEVNVGAINLDAAHGIYVSRITGLTATSASLSTSARSIGAGETLRGVTIKGKPITIEGYILDGDTKTKNDMLSVILPGTTGVLRVAGASKTTPPAKKYYEIDVVVKESPTISQEKHSKFTFQLYAPVPYWRDADIVEVRGFVSGTQKAVLYSGDVETDFALTVEHSMAPMNTLEFEWYGKVRLDFDTPVPSRNVISYKRLANGRISLTIDGVEHNEYIDLDATTMWTVPPHPPLFATLTVTGGQNLTLLTTKLEYYNRYASIMAWN